MYLKLHLKLGEKTLRPWLVFVHGVLGKTFPLVGWVQMVSRVFGADSARVVA